jgi:hypothetical protein
MNVLSRGSLVVVILAGTIATAFASVQVQVTYTGDNVVSGFYKDGSAPQLVGDFQQVTNWRDPQTMTVDLGSNHVYQLIFRVYNNESEGQVFGGAGNPAGFLAEVKGLVASGSLVTSSAWQYAIDPGQGVGNPTWADLNWSQAKAWPYLDGNPDGGDARNGGNNIWNNILGGAIPDISTDAQWIWGDKNGTELGSHENPDAENWLFIRTTITTGVGAAVPEPATMVIWSLLGALGIAIGCWRRPKAA